MDLLYVNLTGIPSFDYFFSIAFTLSIPMVVFFAILTLFAKS